MEGKQGAGPAAGAPPSMTRAEFEDVWAAAGPPADPVRHRELARRYADIIAGHPVSPVQLWRLERLEERAAREAAGREGRWRSAWADAERPTYGRILAAALRYIHRCRWRGTLTPAESGRVLAAATRVLGEGADAPAYAERVRSAGPTAHAALSATMAMLDELRAVRPAAADHLLRPGGPLAAGSRHRGG